MVTKFYGSRTQKPKPHIFAGVKARGVLTTYKSSSPDMALHPKP